MRGLRPVFAIALALAAVPAVARRGAQPGFAEPGDIIAAEGNFTHLCAEKGVKTAIRATAAPDAEIFGPQLMHVVDYANRAADPNLAAEWHTQQVWMSCDGSAAVTHGLWQRKPAIGWYVTIWRRQKGGDYKWVLEEGGPLNVAPPDSDMISATVADCPQRRARNPAMAPPAPDHGKPPVADYTSGHADDATLDWTTTVAPDGSRSFALQLKQDGALHEVLRANAAPGA